MSRSIRLVLLLAASIGFAVSTACGGSSGAPTSPGPDGDAAAGLALEQADDRLAASELGSVELSFDLDEGQRQAIADALAEARAALADLRARWRAGEIGAEATVAEARAIGDTLEAAIDATLTPEQRARIAALRANFRPDLGLTEEQRAEIRAIVDAWRVLVLETIADVRSGELAPRDAAQALAEGAREARAAVCEVFGPEQRELVPRCAATVAG